eukprot:scaffold105638_cov32-Tisochrysis_lutea.AAC.3
MLSLGTCPWLAALHVAGCAVPHAAAECLRAATSPIAALRAPDSNWRPACSLGSARVARPPFAVLLGDGSYKVLSPCAHETATLLVETASRVEDAHWVALMPGVNPLVPPAPENQPLVPSFIANYDSSSIIGEKPLAVGRLRLAEGVIELLASSLPKEDPQHATMLGLVLDHLLLVWLEHIVQNDDGQIGFEDLRASSTLHSAAVLERRGFAEIEFPDMSAMGRGLPISTHAARLPAAIVSYTHRQQTQTLDVSAFNQARLIENILKRLREQEAPASSSGNTPQETPKDDDPWSAMRTSSGY